MAADLERWFAGGGDQVSIRTPKPQETARGIASARHESACGSVPSSKTVADVFRFFLADPAKHRGRKTDMHYENLRAMVVELWGRDRPVSSIDREACRDLLDTLRWLPSNQTKRFPKLTVVQAARLAREKELQGTLSAATVNGYMTKLRTLLNFAVNEGWLDRNPARGLRVVDPVRRRDKRLPFSTEQLRLIFNAPLFTGCVDDWFGYATAGEARPRRGRFWVPLIGLFAGLRLNEACQLDVADVRPIDGVECIIVSAGSGSPEKRLKTATSERVVPIHPELRRIGFTNFVERQRARQERKLFPELQISSTGYYSDPFSKWFRRFLFKAGAERPLTCFHSFRHCFRDALRDAHVDREIALALGGWTSGDSSASEGAYGRGPGVKTLSTAIERIRYPLSLTHLHERY